MRAAVKSRRNFLKATTLASLATGLGVYPPHAAFALEPGRPSRTALGAALQRAAHQLLETPQVFDDPLALRIFGSKGVALLAGDLDRYRTAGSRAMRAFLVMRSRYAEDELARAVSQGVTQYVVLGAGLDTFAYRNPHRQLRVFEVDHPSTQAWKRSMLKQQSIDVPRSLTYAPVDFERQTIAAGLRAAGFSAGKPAFFSWLGVVIYLSPEAVTGTLRYVASCARGSELVFDFAPPLASMDAEERRRVEAAAARVAKIGEPWMRYYSPAQLAGELESAGFSATHSLGSAEMNERYFGNRVDGFRLYGSGRIMAARV